MNDFDALKAAVAEGRAMVCVFAVNGRPGTAYGGAVAGDGTDGMVSGVIINGHATGKEMAALVAAVVVKATEAPKIFFNNMDRELAQKWLEQVCDLIEFAGPGGRPTQRQCDAP